MSSVVESLYGTGQSQGSSPNNPRPSHDSLSEPPLPKSGSDAIPPPSADQLSHDIPDVPPDNKDNDGRICDCSTQGKNLVVCLDGTANQFSVKSTNVVELYSRLINDEKQMTYYNSGIGTYVPSSKSWYSVDARKQALVHAWDMAVASSFKDKILSAYQWLSENYGNQDRIFLFGFSRGAYQVRVIAGMIEKVGLLRKGNNEQIPFAFELYSKTNKTRNSTAHTAADEKDEKLRNHFKAVFSRKSVKVHFIGVWDTVSSIGVLKGPSFPETTNGMMHVCAFRHALALDELRVKFLPEYANGGDGPPEASNKIKEVWFAGSHSDIGGGNDTNEELDKFGPALRWMSYEAIEAGLKMEQNTKKWGPLRLNKSMNPFWKFVDCIPLSRLSYKGHEDLTRRPHISSPRVIQGHQLIHESVFDQMDMDIKQGAPFKKPYVPKPKAPNPSQVDTLDADRSRTGGKEDRADRAAQWKRLRDSNMVEKDPYLAADRILDVIRDTGEVNKAQTVILLSLIDFESGRRSVLDYPESLKLLVGALDKAASQDQFQSDVFEYLVRVLAIFEPVLPVPKIRTRKMYTGPVFAGPAYIGDILEHVDALEEVVDAFKDIFSQEPKSILKLLSVFNEYTLKLYVANDTLQKLEVKKDEILRGRPSLRFLKLVDHADDADFSLVGDASLIWIEILQQRCPSKDYALQSYWRRLASGMDGVRSLLHDVLQFYFHFHRVSGLGQLNTNSRGEISIKYKEVKYSEANDEDTGKSEADNEDRSEIGTKTHCIEIHEHSKGRHDHAFAVKNNTSSPLYIWPFHAEMYKLSSGRYFAYMMADAPLSILPRQSLQIPIVSMKEGNSPLNFIRVYYSNQSLDSNGKKNTLDIFASTFLHGRIWDQPKTGWKYKMSTIPIIKILRNHA